MNAARLLFGWACLGSLSCGGSSREPLANVTGGQAGAMAAGAGGSAGVAGAAAGAAADAGFVAIGGMPGTGGGTASGGANAEGGTAGQVPVPTHAEQVAAVGPYCNALATICPNFETDTCIGDGIDRLPLEGFCYAEQVRRNMCTMLLPPDDLQCSSASSGRAKTGFCDVEQGAVVTCIGRL